MGRRGEVDEGGVVNNIDLLGWAGACDALAVVEEGRGRELLVAVGDWKHLGFRGRDGNDGGAVGRSGFRRGELLPFVGVVGLGMLTFFVQLYFYFSLSL